MRAARSRRRHCGPVSQSTVSSPRRETISHSRSHATSASTKGKRHIGVHFQHHRARAGDGSQGVVGPQAERKITVGRRCWHNSAGNLCRHRPPWCCWRTPGWTIIAILGSGISFKRMLFPYFIAATVLCSLSLLLNNWIIPPANKTRLEFENRYIRNAFVLRAHNFHRQIKPGEYMYFESYNNAENTGYRFSYETLHRW